MSSRQSLQISPTVDPTSFKSDPISRLSSPSSHLPPAAMVVTSIGTGAGFSAGFSPGIMSIAKAPTPIPISLPSPLSADSFSSLSPPMTIGVAPDVHTDEPDSPTGAPSNTAQALPDVDAQILEALKSKDRLYVLKLGELMEGLINERRARIDLTPATSYQRLLVHRCSAYYKLSPENDPASKGIFVVATAESRIPTRRLCDLVPAEATAHPAFKIMRRAPDRRLKQRSQSGSAAGDEADLSDVEPSESGSLGGRSNATGGSSKKRMTIEEREAAYNEARNRIFMDFEEKEKEKEKDMSASSSSFSVVSGSASTSGGGGSSPEDLDDSVGTPATESEWSGPVARDKKEGRRSGNASVASSSRSLRSSAPPFATNGSGSSRGSRAPSPAFTYASLYEPPQAASSFDPSPHAGGGPSPPYMSQYLYQYPPPGQPGNPPFLPPYPYFPPYPYQQPHSQQNNSDPSTPSELYQSHQQHQLPQPQPQMSYGNPYAWGPPHQPSLPPMQNSQSAPQSHPNSHMLTPPAQSPVQYPPTFIPSYAYPMAYYPPPPGQQIQSSHMNAQHTYADDVPRSLSGNGFNDGSRNGHSGYISSNHSRSSSRASASATNGNGNSHGKRNGAALPPRTSSWSYGPGVSMGGFGVVNPGVVGDIVGPRFNSTVRRTSNNSSGGSGNSRSSAGDEASSTASSSTTSSSSRRTYTSTTSSQHPLPARPDWAVGLKPQPPPYATHNRQHDHSLNTRNMPPISPPRNLNGGESSQSNMLPRQPTSQQLPPVLLQATDFPPLTSLSSMPEKRAPTVAGAWTNSSSTRSILMPSPGANVPGNALIHHAAGNAGTRLEEPGFERPPSKGTAELFNPKIVRRPGSINGKPAQSPDKASSERERDRARGEVVANAILVGQVNSMSLGDPVSKDQASNGPKESPAPILAVPT